ncbi:MAG: chromate transporter, partial [Sphaerochaetaceae bacterium]|nr:chromate transporter [Sphaerochaetaceae bacterium]
SLVYEWVKDNSLIQDLLEGMRVGVSAVILHAVYVMARTITRKKDIISITIMVVAFILSYFLQLNILLVIAFGIISGLIHYLASDKRGQA